MFQPGDVSGVKPWAGDAHCRGAEAGVGGREGEAEGQGRKVMDTETLRLGLDLNNSVKSSNSARV